MHNAFRSARLIYRAIESPQDDAFLLSIDQNPAGYANSHPGLLKPISKKDSDDLRNHFASKTLIGVLICLPPPNAPSDGAALGAVPESTPIGRIDISRSDPERVHHRKGTIGVSIVPPYQSQGYGSEAIRWILDWGFRIAGLHRIEICCFSYNDGARRLYERLGFTPEGRRREAFWFNGGWHDDIVFGMLEHEWRERQAQH